MASQAAPDLAPDLAERLDRYAKCLGLAFQIRDDILDIEAPTEILGKTHGKDLAQFKATYPALMGLDGARQAAADLVTEALVSLEPFDAKADPLRWIALYIVQRDR
jgi:geranylgeranyl pyrophosphate synthase